MSATPDSDRGEKTKGIVTLEYRSQTVAAAEVPAEQVRTLATPTCPTCGVPMVAGFILGSGTRLRWVEQHAPPGLFRWLSGQTIGRVGYRAELRAHRCEACRVIVAKY